MPLTDLPTNKKATLKCKKIIIKTLAKLYESVYCHSMPVVRIRHDRRVDKNPYRHDRRADKNTYRHDRRADSQCQNIKVVSLVWWLFEYWYCQTTIAN